MKKVLKVALKTVATITLAYVAIIAIATALFPKLVPNEEEDDDYDDIYDNPEFRQDIEKFGREYDEYDEEFGRTYYEYEEEFERSYDEYEQEKESKSENAGV